MEDFSPLHSYSFGRLDYDSLPLSCQIQFIAVILKENTVKCEKSLNNII